MTAKITTLLLFAAITQSALAQESEKPMGWSKNANLGLNLSFSSSKDVVGQTDGSSQTYGTNIKSNFILNTQDSEWRNEFLYSGATTKTPSVPRFVKSSDNLKLSTIYLFSLPSYPKVGPYARAEASTPLFRGEDVRSEVKTYQITDTSGTSTTVTGTSLRLTDSFKPLTTKEAVGFFYRPVQEEHLKIELRAGLAAQQTAAAGQLAVKGVDSATGNILVEELRDVSQFGTELAFNLKGKLNESSGYEVGAETLTPFVNNKAAGDDRDALRLTNIEAFAKLSSNITSWATFGYDYKLKIQPQLVDRAQQIHMLVFNVNYNMF